MLTLLPLVEQQRLLFLEAVDGREPVTEQGVRPGLIDSKYSTTTS